MSFDFKSLNDVVYYMLHHLRLSRVDRSFLSNFLELVRKNNFVSVNQDNLLRHLIRKYKRQLSKYKVDSDLIVTLPYKHNLIESKTTSYLSIIDDYIYFKGPFKSEFQKELRNCPLPMLEWVKENKHYKMPFSISGLSTMKKMVDKHYTDVVACDNIKEFLLIVEEFKTCKYWNPTLVYKNDRLLVLASNESLDKAISNIELLPTCKTIADLVRYGITIDDTVTEYLLTKEDKAKVKLAKEFVTEIDYDLAPEVFQWLKEFGCDGIFYTSSFKRIGNNLYQQYKKAQRKANIPTIMYEEELTQYKNPVIVSPFSFNLIEYQTKKHVFKRIKWLNSKPVKIK